MLPSTEATADGILQDNPFAHLVVYALDRRITGELFLIEPSGVVHALVFRDGIPTKIRVSDDFERLGSLLVSGGHIDNATLEGALATRGLLGDLLVLTGCVAAEVIDEMLCKQFVSRFVRMFGVSAQTQFKYFDQSDTLAHWGGEPFRMDPLRLLWAGLSVHALASSQYHSTLEMLRDVPLTLHPMAPHERFGLPEEAKEVLDSLLQKPQPLSSLEVMCSISAETMRTVVYALMITRQFEFGKGVQPVGVSYASVARLQLKSEVHRIGAAAPDQAGEGERTPVRPIEIRRVGGKFSITASSESDGDASNPWPLAAEESGSRICPEALTGVPTANIVRLAVQKIDDREPELALGLCRSVEEREAFHVEARAVGIWASAQLSGADLSSLLASVHEIVEAEPQLTVARYVRGILLKRLGDHCGATAEFREVLAQSPDDERARRELSLLETRRSLDDGTSADTGFGKV